jgi:hypothetical protein
VVMQLTSDSKRRYCNSSIEIVLLRLYVNEEERFMADSSWVERLASC